MKIFDYKDKKYIEINGKEFYLIQGFREYNRRGSDEFIFVQVFGKTPLQYEDLPGKGWNIIKTKTKQGIVYTAYQENYFDYETIPAERGDSKKNMLFVGRNQAGSLYLSLFVCAKMLGISITEQELLDAAKRLIHADPPHFYPLLKIEDAGNEGNTAFLLRGIGQKYGEMGIDDFDSLTETT